VNGFGPAHIEKSHFKGIFGCIFRQSLMKYGGNKSIKENSLRPCVLIPEDNRHSTVTRKIPLFSVEPVTISYTHFWVHWFLPVKYFTCKNYLDCDIFRYFYFFTKYIALLSLIVNTNEVFIYNMKNISLSFCSILYDILNLYTCKKTERKMNFEIVQLPN
jgi:hypothetical protein